MLELYVCVFFVVGNLYFRFSKILVLYQIKQNQQKQNKFPSCIFIKHAGLKLLCRMILRGECFYFFSFYLQVLFFLLLLIYLITFVIQMERSCNDNEWDFNTNNQQINELYFGGNK
eukprot:TRINITY_DN3905_c0_g1_i9.p7 TRINITY_DN3905_c0_g1~~TRINITY_DN3905_c0_g1_i9.p7  ORF type:complete len:116 (-),score=3.68 TRINITY_DN3905_c0_g1_i9:109-456(-)